jgi:hypothetical protein
MLNDEERLPRQENARRNVPLPIRWNAFKLRYALTQETLIGKYLYGKSSEVKIPVEIPAILTLDDWDRVQAVIEATRKQHFRKPHIFPLSSRLVSPCGLTYSGTYDAYMGRRYYRCKGRESQPYCSCHRIQAQPVEDQAFEEVLSFLEDPKRLLAVTGLDKEETQESRREALRTLDAKIANLDEAITNRVADALSHNVPGDRIASAVEKMESDLASLIERRERIAEHQAQKREREERRARLSLLARASLTLVNSTLEQKKLLFNVLDVRATVTEDGLVIAGILSETLPAVLGVEAVNYE